MALTGPEREMIDNLRLEVARAAEREAYASRDIQRLEGRLVKKIDEVEGECVGFREAAQKRWEAEDRRRLERSERSATIERDNLVSKRMYMLGVIGAIIASVSLLMTMIGTLVGS